MTSDEALALEEGTVIQNIGTGEEFVVVTRCSMGRPAVAVQTAWVTRPAAWRILRRPELSPVGQQLEDQKGLPHDEDWGGDRG